MRILSSRKELEIGRALRMWRSLTARGDSGNLDDQNGTGKTAILELMETDFSGLTLQNESLSSSAAAAASRKRNYIVCACCGVLGSVISPRRYCFNVIHEIRILLCSLGQCFSTAGPRPGTGPWHQLYRAARGLRKLQYAAIFH